MTETRTYTGESSTTAFDGFLNLRIGRHYTGVLQDDGLVLVSAVGSLVGTDILVTSAEWEQWFKK